MLCLQVVIQIELGVGLSPACSSRAWSAHHHTSMQISSTPSPFYNLTVTFGISDCVGERKSGYWGGCFVNLLLPLVFSFSQLIFRGEKCRFSGRNGCFAASLATLSRVKHAPQCQSVSVLQQGKPTTTAKIRKPVWFVSVTQFTHQLLTGKVFDAYKQKKKPCTSFCWPHFSVSWGTGVDFYYFKGVLIYLSLHLHFYLFFFSFFKKYCFWTKHKAAVLCGTMISESLWNLRRGFISWFNQLPCLHRLDHAILYLVWLIRSDLLSRTYSNIIFLY